MSHVWRNQDPCHTDPTAILRSFDVLLARTRKVPLSPGTPSSHWCLPMWMRQADRRNHVFGFNAVDNSDKISFISKVRVPGIERASKGISIPWVRSCPAGRVSSSGVDLWGTCGWRLNPNERSRGVVGLHPQYESDSHHVSVGRPAEARGFITVIASGRLKTGLPVGKA